jgi:replication-associated recombination protein RarA
MFLFELPTTGALSFADVLSDPSGAYTAQISAATQARANVRAVLKESKRTDGEKDWLRLIKVS